MVVMLTVCMHFVLGYSKIVYTDYNVMLQYQCDYLRDDGTCEPNSVIVLLWQRVPRLQDQSDQVQHLA